MTLTRLTEAQLVAIRAQGHEQAGRSPFVDPYTIAECGRVLDRRGEGWAAAVLGRDISRRSIAVPLRPYLRDGEPEAIVYADREENIAALPPL